MSNIQKIVVGSFYCPPGSRKKSVLLDHIAEVFHTMSSRYKNIHWIICADSNELKLDAILNLSPDLKQIVKGITRVSSQSMLDPVMTTLHSFYQTPKLEKPLDSDDSSGSPSDHMMVLVEPLNTVENKKIITKETINIRSFSEDNY